MLMEVSTSFLTRAKGIGRTCAQCFVILITDGEQNKGKADPVDEANKLRQNKNCIVYVVSIGNPNSKELKEIAGSQDNVFSVNKFNELNTVVQGIVRAACSDSACRNTILVPVPMPIMVPASHPVNENYKNGLQDLMSLLKSSRPGYGHGNKFKPRHKHYAFPGRYAVKTQIKALDYRHVYS
ncbi:COL6A [Mytilus coruscus]|uniref:COL6A n=1 Tax=Mytilus coruscus TaxID=42192 RepID=A0A6J8BW31_MYTCO|nr:COL6A [Mytilus coruscus]